MDVAESKLTVEIHNIKPIELGDLANCFFALGAQFSKFADAHPDHRYPHEGKLYVKEVRKGSVIAELIAYAPVVVASASEANAIFDFGVHLRNLIDYFSGSKSALPSVDVKDCENVAAIAKVAASDQGSNIIFLVSGNGNHFDFGMDSKKAFSVRQRATLEKDKREHPTSALRERVTLFWYQTRNALKKNAGDRAVIDEISPKHVKVIFLDDTVKARILESEDNMYHQAYVVSVIASFRDGQPISYKIVALHETFPIEEDEVLL